MAIDFKAERIDQSPLDRPRTQQGIDFDYETDRNAVGRTKIKNFNFSSGYGGTIVLGGTANGNGLMLVKDASGATIVTVDNAGIEVEGGNIVVKNANNTTIIDTSGIVSSANFPNDQVFSNTTNSTSGTTATDLPGSSLDSFVLSRTTNVLINASAWGYNPAFSNDGHSVTVRVVDSVDGTIISFPIYGIWALESIDFAGSAASNTVEQQAVTLPAIIDLSAGTHTLKLQYNAFGGGTAVVDAFLLNYIILGA